MIILVGWALLSIALIFLIGHLVTISLYLRRLVPTRRQPGTLGLPYVSLLRPVCGRDAFDDETLRSSFLQNYPRYEIIFCAPHENDASVPMIRHLIASYPHVPAQLLFGQVALTGNPKLNNLWKGWHAAKADWICMTDSNLLLTPDYLRTVVGSWGPRTGLVSCPPVGERPDGLAGSLECAFLNSNQARLQFAAGSFGQGFAQGKTLFWNRAMLNRAGGIAELGRYLAEDVNATKLVRAMGLQVSLTPLPFAQPIGRRSFGQVWDRQLRWSRVRRDGFPVLFGAEVVNGSVGAIAMFLVACASFGLSFWPVLPFLALWYGAEVYLMRRARWPSGWRDVLALPLRDVLLPILWGTTFLARGIEWRGTAMAAPMRGDLGADVFRKAETAL